MVVASVESAKGVLKLGHLPLIARALRRLRLAELVDERVPPDKRSRVTTGQCVEAMIVAILSGSHTLYLIDQLLAGYDLELGLGWDEEAGAFHDQRLARALDALWQAGADAVVAAAFVRAVRAYLIDASVCHLDLTTSPLHGRYALSRPPENPEDPSAVPHVTNGRSKEYKPGLKQIVFGIGVTRDGAIPAVGHVASGNRGDAPELRYLMKRVAERVADPSKVTIVGDSKLCAGETLLLARTIGFDFLTLIPKTTNVRAEALTLLVEAERKGQVEVLLEKDCPRSGEHETWRGCSFDLVYKHKDEEDRVTEIPIRALAVTSTTLERRKRASLEKARTRERRKLEKERAALLKKSHLSPAQANKVAAGLASKHARFHRLETRMRVEARLKKRTKRGRPSADEVRETEEHWIAWFEIESDERAFDEELATDSRFVLVTSHPKTGPRGRSDAELLSTYHDQCRVEGAQHWLKGTLDFAPIFLKTERRVAALGQVYVLALMVYALIQRDMRAELGRQGATIAGNLKPTDKPTTEVAFRLFANVTTVRRPGEPIRIEHLTTEQVNGYRVLGIDVLSLPGVVAATPRKPRPGDRGYYHPRPKGRPRLPQASESEGSRNPRVSDPLGTTSSRRRPRGEQHGSEGTSQARAPRTR